MSAALDVVTSIKVKLGLLVVASALVAGVLTLLGSAADVSALLVLPVTVALALGVTQLLAAGMVAPLRQMTEVTRAMARGDYSGRVHTTSTDEVGQLAAAFNRMAEDLATVDRERRELIATVSHELRTPLTAMTALLENLADGVVVADAENLGGALEQARRLGALVADLLQLSRLEAGIVDLDRQPIILRTLVEECVEQVQAVSRTGKYDVRIPPDLVVSADPARLRQLVVNVLDNAVRHSPSKSAVRVTGGTGPGNWWLVVTDEGSGVMPADRERVFDRFGTDGAGGTGLGLAVARWAAQIHGGSLRFVDPAPGVGAQLRLDVPLSPPIPPRTLTHTTSATRVQTPSPPLEASMSTTRTAHPQRFDTVVQPPRDQPAMDAMFGRFWPETGLPSGLRTVVASLVAGVFAGSALSLTAVGISWTLVFLTCGIAALLTARRHREPWTLTCAALALLLVLPTALLDAWWIHLVGIITATVVFLCGITGARTAPGIVWSAVAWPLAALRGLPWFGRSLRVIGTGNRTPALLRTFAWSLLGLAVFGSIFASANPVFGSWVDELVPSLSFNDLVGRTFLACAFFAMTLGAGYLALNPARVELWSARRPTPLSNRFEWLAPVLVVDAVFVAFVGAQARAILGGHDYVETTTGLTYADYVHQGFGQITLATALTVLVVWVASRRAGRDIVDQWWLRASVGLLCGLTLLVVASALHGMSVYQDAYGFTTLRLFVDVFEGWLGFVVLAIMLAGLFGVGRWLPRVALVSAAVALIGLAAINPDAWVAGRNIDRYDATGKLDTYYLGSLSADAIPVIAERLPVDVAGCVLQWMPGQSFSEEVLGDARAWNLSRQRAEVAVRRLGLSMDNASMGDCALPEYGSGGE